MYGLSDFNQKSKTFFATSLFSTKFRLLELRDNAHTRVFSFHKLLMLSDNPYKKTKNFF